MTLVTRLLAFLIALVLPLASMAQVEGVVQGASKIYTSTSPMPVSTGGTGASSAQAAAQGLRYSYLLAKSGICFIHVSSGSIGNNGALTGITALPATYSEGCYVYYPANSIAAGVAAGWYWSVFSSSTAATIYNSTWSGTGVPTPGTLTAFSTTGPGAFTGDTTERVAVTITLPASSIGANGGLDLFTDWTCNSTAGTKTARLRWDGAAGTQFLNNAFSTDVTVTMRTLIRNKGLTNKNYGYSVGTSTGVGSRATSASFTAIDSTAGTTLVISLQKGTATDNLTLEGFQFYLVSDGS